MKKLRPLTEEERRLLYLETHDARVHVTRFFWKMEAQFLKEEKDELDKRVERYLNKKR